MGPWQTINERKWWQLNSIFISRESLHAWMSAKCFQCVGKCAVERERARESINKSVGHEVKNDTWTEWHTVRTTEKGWEGWTTIRIYRKVGKSHRFFKTCRKSTSDSPISGKKARVIKGRLRRCCNNRGSSTGHRCGIADYTSALKGIRNHLSPANFQVTRKWTIL